MNNRHVTLQDKYSNIHHLMRVKDLIVDPIKKTATCQWLWIYKTTSEFFPFELWTQLDRVQVNEKLVYKDLTFKVIHIDDEDHPLFS